MKILKLDNIKTKMITEKLNKNKNDSISVYFSKLKQNNIKMTAKGLTKTETKMNFITKISLVDNIMSSVSVKISPLQARFMCTENTTVSVITSALQKPAGWKHISAHKSIFCQAEAIRQLVQIKTSSQLLDIASRSRSCSEIASTGYFDVCGC
jgi:hypothetical protein